MKSLKYLTAFNELRACGKLLQNIAWQRFSVNVLGLAGHMVFLATTNSTFIMQMQPRQ